MTSDEYKATLEHKQERWEEVAQVEYYQNLKRQKEKEKERHRMRIWGLRNARKNMVKPCIEARVKLHKAIS